MPRICGDLPRASRILSLAIVLATLAFSGCTEPEVSKDTRKQQELLQRADRGEALIKAATTQLADLPAAVDTELRPPTVILDSTKSMNNQDVLAVAVMNPNTPGTPVNAIIVPGGNGRFKAADVRSGDILKYYVVEDETIDEERQAAGFSRKLAKELTIAQVVDDNTLLIEGSLPEQVEIPSKIEVWRNVDDRLEKINEELNRYAERRLPPVGWEPSPDEQVLVQIVAWLNQWLRQTEPKTEWKREPLLDALDADLLANAELKGGLTAPALAEQTFNSHDGQLLQEAVWLRDISRWAQGEDFNDLARATALFDWTVRNIQLEPDENAPPRRPWRTLVEGRGTANERAWVFALLCRQQALDVVMLEVSGPPKAEAPKDGESPATGDSEPRWIPALVLNDQLYLFDTRLGLPMPGPNGEGVATLKESAELPELLKRLGVKDANNVTAYVVADPFSLSRRASQLESKLTGDDHLVITSSPSQLAAQLKKLPWIKNVKLWDVPFRTLHDQLTLGKSERLKEALAFEPFATRPLLWKARMRHFQGRREHDPKASEEEAIDDHREAAQLYTSKSVRPPDTQIQRLSSAEERRVDTAVKEDATYWVGLLSFDEGKYAVAADWLGRPGLGDANSPWSSGARYNLARSLEAQGKFEDAAKLLEEDASPQREGNLLRAKKLRAQAAERVKKNNEGEE